MSDSPDPRDAGPSPPWLVATAWLLVGAPLAWGVYTTLAKAALLFR